MQLGQFIAKLRKMRGWSQEMLAEKVGMSRFAIMAWEKDRVDLSDKKKTALAKALNMDPADFEKVQDLEPDDLERLYKDIAKEDSEGDGVLPSQDIIVGERHETNFNAIVLTLNQMIDQLKGTKDIRNFRIAKKIFENSIEEIEEAILDLQREEEKKGKALSQEDEQPES